MSVAEKLRERFQVNQDYQELFRSERGKRVLLHMMKTAGIINPVFSTDPSTLLLDAGHKRFAYSVLHRALGSQDKVGEYILNQTREHVEEQNHAV